MRRYIKAMDSNCIISRIQQEDIPALVELLKSNNMNDDAVESQWPHYFKVMDDGRLIGCFAVVPRTGYAEIKSLLVLKENRSWNLMNRIGNAITAEVLGLNLLCAAVKTDRDNPAVLLYRYKGFKPLSEDEYGVIYREFRKDCLTCDRLAQNTCSPVYLVFDAGKRREWVEQWTAKHIRQDDGRPCFDSQDTPIHVSIFQFYQQTMMESGERSTPSAAFCVNSA